MKKTSGDNKLAFCVMMGVLLFFLLCNPQAPAAEGKPKPISQNTRPEGFLDSIQMTKDTLQAQGWAGSVNPANPVTGIAIYVRDLKWDSLVDLEIYSGGFEKMQRPDVAKFKKRPDWTESGFRIRAEISPPLKQGLYQIWAAGILKNGECFALDHSIEPVQVQRFRPDSFLYKIDLYFKGNFLASGIFWVSVLVFLIVGGIFLSLFLKKRTKHSEFTPIPAQPCGMRMAPLGCADEPQIIEDKVKFREPKNEVIVEESTVQVLPAHAVSEKGPSAPNYQSAEVRLKFIRKEMARIFEKAQKHILNNTLPLIGLDKNKKILILSDQPETCRWFFIGDIHGDFFALHRLLESAKSQPDFRVCFLGDLVNGGHYDLECFALLLQTVMENPDRVVWIAGDHDEALDYNASADRKFSSKLDMGFFADALNAPDGRRNRQKVESWGRLFIELVAGLPRAVLFPDGLLATHGGIPSEDKSPGLKSVEDFDSPLILRDFTCGRYSLLPRKRKEKAVSQPPYQNADLFFDHKDMEQFCRSVKPFFSVWSLIRGHDHVENGWQRSTGFKTLPILTINGFGFNNPEASYEGYSEALVLGVYRKNEAPDFEYVTYDEKELAPLAANKNVREK